MTYLEAVSEGQFFLCREIGTSHVIVERESHEDTLWPLVGVFN